MDIFWTELSILLCLFVGNLLFGNLPFLLFKLVGSFSNSEDERNTNIKLPIIFLYAAAGVFISDSFVVLLPKANREFSISAHHSHEQNENSTGQHTGHHHDSIPIPEFIILCSFFLAYVGQEIIFYVLTKLRRTSRIFLDKRISYCTCAKRHTECSRTFKDTKGDQTLYGLERKLEESSHIPIIATAEVNIIPQAETTPTSELLRSSIIVQPVPNYGAVTNATEPPIDNPLPVLRSPILLANERRIAVEQYNEAKYQNKFLINSTLISTALTLQYIFSGINLGLESQRFHKFTYLFIICLQNFILNFAAGSYLVVGNLKFFYNVLIMGLLSFVSPVVLIYIMIENTEIQEPSHLIKGVAFAFSCGVLLYTIFCGVLRQKYFHGVSGLTKFSAVLIGAGIMIGLQYLISIYDFI